MIRTVIYSDIIQYINSILILYNYMMFSVPKYLNEPQNYFKGEWSKS